MPPRSPDSSRALLRPGGVLIQDVQLGTLPFVPADRWWESIYLAATVRGMFPARPPTVRFLSNKRGYSATFGRDLLDAGFDPRDVMDKSALRDVVVAGRDRAVRSRVPARARRAAAAWPTDVLAGRRHRRGPPRGRGRARSGAVAVGIGTRAWRHGSSAGSSGRVTFRTGSHGSRDVDGSSSTTRSRTARASGGRRRRTDRSGRTPSAPN